MVARTTLAFLCLSSFMMPATLATDGVKGITVRPKQENAKVQGCKIAAPGNYETNVGDLIELDYTYPVVPEAIPKQVDSKETLTGAVAKSSLGFRMVTTPKMVGVTTIAFYFEAKKQGEDTVTLSIDESEYTYKFTVTKK